ncbi:MAG: N-acetylmuramoyl-L-alanine amidase [Planctomycetes bacterium]|nr:N-acetylmuramoyl-L-alanine amidase [Planctomycetota bacterium]MBU2458492.1 N-acetylmuramoyl-L-alanine amidase [Planctomycetota bacterium]MBU2597135.1 N-acetylmuramoyl-L-alanine amidase [Planctomycetota bacterium]
MSSQPRETKILIYLVVSMTIGAALLMALDSQSISAGAFSLASYSSLGSISSVTQTRQGATADRWDRIEVFYSNTKGGDLAQLASLSGLTSPDDLNFHFVVCNSLGALDGQIQSTEKWLNQWSALPGAAWYGSSKTIRICVIGEGKRTPASDYQVSRIQELIDSLSRKYDISPTNVSYPAGWQL